MRDCCRETLLSLHSASEVADELGISRQSVHALAVRLGLGILVHGRMAVYTPADVDAMRKARGAIMPVWRAAKDAGNRSSGGRH